MRDFDDTTLWRVSAFERVREQTGTSGFARLGGPTLLPTTLLAELRRLEAGARGDDVLEVVAACLRHREPALLCLQHEELVWPVTVFPHERLYHSPRDFALASPAGLATLRLLSAEPPGVRAPGHFMHERVGATSQYRPLGPMLWRLALHGPRRVLLDDIAGPAAYRVVQGSAGERPTASGALGSALERLQRASTPLRDVARWPGMSVERAARLLNGLYLSGCLLVTRTHPALQDPPSGAVKGGWLAWRRARR